ncbi:unnamed protein product [Adineta steineri]|uniref:Uncharacterized protein n=1 Tax=Adineta steineri TaxID=433720 RepID=A0A813Y5V2_9BILA|nr:unnamed protein product [Adineta steineri]CAF4011956.1 unnamed protein product [Adineta steineri]
MTSVLCHIIISIFIILLVTTFVQNISEPVIHFSGKINGANPQSTLIELNNTGVLYGVTRNGGNSSDDLGVIYRIDTIQNNTFTVIHHFTNNTGCHPVSPLVFDNDVFLFGSTIRCGQFGYGNLFRFNLSDHTFNIIYEFHDIANPENLFLDTNSGLLYGVTGVGSSTFYGSVFTIDIRHKTPSTTFKQLFSFNYGVGAFPSNLILVNSSLYINTQIFGRFGGGTLIKMDLDGKNAELIYAFGGDKALGCCPWGQLVLVTNGRDQYLYGTTMGAAECPSTIYRVGLTTITNQIELVVTFNETTVGSAPFDGLIQSINSSLLYGVTSQGGMNNRGTIFRLSINNDESLEKLFDIPSDDIFGYETLGGLLEVRNNSFYGPANLGGKYGLGTIYKVTIN